MQIFKKNTLLLFFTLLGLSFTAWGAGFFVKGANPSSTRVGLNSVEASSDMTEQRVIARLKISFNGEEVLVSLFESGASRQLLAQLPLTLSFEDFARTEKIAYLPSKLNTANTPMASDVTGDFNYYKPWGNLAIFYKGFGSSGELYVLGRIDAGKEKLAAMQQNFTATIEEIE